MSFRVRHLICDLDNTLYDWVGFFVPSFYAMVERLTDILQCDREALLDDLQRIHRHYHDAEHAFAVLDTDIVRQRYKGWTKPAVAAELDPAFHAFNRSRLDTLHAYPGVHDTLSALRQEGIILVAHSEAKYHAIVDRLLRLELLQYFTRVYCRERSTSSHPAPNEVRVRGEPSQTAKIVELKHHQRKPSPEVLLEICAREGADPGMSAFVGDSMSKDIVMAKDAGVYAIWAEYGATVSAPFYEQLVRVSHWTQDEVKEEARLKEKAQGVTPDATLRSFGELLKIISPTQTSDHAVA